MPRGTQSTQADQRRNYVNRDQFGRRWLVTIEKETGDPTGLICPCFSDPLNTPQKYVRVPHENRGAIIVDFDRWIGDVERAWKDWVRFRDKIGRAQYADRYNPRDPPSSVLDEAGPPPIDPRKLEQGRDGDPALLGLAPLGPAERPDDRVPAVAEVDAPEPGEPLPTGLRSVRDFHGPPGE